ncbi:MAG: hypothetical protein ACRCWW_14275 [Scandinavium sp.]|uniref:hypothetical protein n=1 Tax=Scandinavium sp. TaxID=2830653 RepID=UPI003F2B2FE5
MTNNKPTEHRLQYLASHHARVVNISGEELALIVNELREHRLAEGALRRGYEAAELVSFCLDELNVPKELEYGPLSLWDRVRQYGQDSAAERAELQEYRKAAPIEINDEMAFAFCRAISDDPVGADDAEDIKIGLRAAFANVAAPQLSGNSEHAIQPYKLPDNSFTNEDLEGMIHGNNPQSNAYRELLSLRLASASSYGSYQVIPDGWVMVPFDATRAMIDAARRVEEDGYDAMHKAMIAAAPQQE